MTSRDWQRLQVSEICRLQNGNSFKPHQWDNKGLPIIRIQNLNGNKKFNFYSGEINEKWLVETGQLLFSWAGTKGVSFGPMIWKGEKGVLNQHIYKVFNNDDIDKEWLYLALKWVTSKIEAQAHGFKATLVHVQKKALIQQLLKGKKRLFDDYGNRFKSEWGNPKASELFGTVSIKNNSEDEELLAVTQDQGAIPRSILGRRVAMPEGSTKGYKLVVPGNFIISLRSFQGGLEYSNYRGLVSPAYTVLEPIRPIFDDFYKHYYKSYDFIGHLAVAVVGIRDGKQISYKDFSFLQLPYPPVEEQKKIASVLTNADEEIQLLQKQLADLKQEKKALMQQLLTGKRRVKLEGKAA